MELGLSDSDAPAVAERFRAIGSTAREMSGLLEGLMRPAPVEPAALDLNNLAQEVARAFMAPAQVKEIQLTVEATDEPALVHAEALASREILDNLVSNAIKFTPRGGCATIRVEATAVVVEDNGPGIDAEDRARLFERFAQLSARPTGGETSTGLGLYIVKRLMRVLGGKIECESEPGEGARFRASWPAAG